MNIQKIFALLGVILIVCSGAIIFSLTKDLALNISETASQSANDIPPTGAPQLKFAEFEAIDPESAGPTITLFRENSKNDILSLKIGDDSAKLIPLKHIAVGKSSTDTQRPAKGSDLNFDGNHQLVSDLISPELLLGNRTSFILFFSKTREISPGEIEEPFAWGDCNNSRAFVHLTNTGLNFHFGPPEERLDINNFNINKPVDNQLLILDVKINGAEVEKNLYLNNMHLGRILIKNSKLGFSIHYPLIIGGSQCNHPFRGQIHKFYIFKDVSDEKLMRIAKFLYSNARL